MAEQILSGGLKVKTNQIVHNERLEYLGDAVVEMVTRPFPRFFDP